MPRPRRILFPNTIVFISTRVQEGLPFVPNPHINNAIDGIMARACELYPVSLIGYVFMANHMHIMLMVEDPLNVVSFIRKIKTETAHLINKLLGRKQRSVWCAGYHAATLLTFEDCINKLVYIYTNPQKANLVEKIDDYPGVSSWHQFKSGKLHKKCTWQKRTEYEPVSNKLSFVENSGSKKSCLLKIDPYSWLSKLFPSYKIDKKQFFDLIMQKVRNAEKDLSEQRKINGTRVIGAAKLIQQQINKEYAPKSFGKRMWCICHDKATKIFFIRYVKSLIIEAREVYLAWKSGNLKVKYPPELFQPPLPKISTMLPLYPYSQ